MKTVAIRLRRTQHYSFPGQEERSISRSAGVVIGDCAIKTAEAMVRAGVADYYHVGQPRHHLEFLAKGHPLSIAEAHRVRRRMEEMYMIFAAGSRPW